MSKAERELTSPGLFLLQEQARTHLEVLTKRWASAIDGFVVQTYGRPSVMRTVGARRARVWRQRGVLLTRLAPTSTGKARYGYWRDLN